MRLPFSFFKQGNSEYEIIDATARDNISEMKVTFQDGVDTIYNAIVAQGVTPTESTPSAIANSVGDVRAKGRGDVGDTYTVRFSGTIETTSANTITFNIAPNTYFVVGRYISRGLSYAGSLRADSGCSIINQTTQVSPIDSVAGLNIAVCKATANSVTVSHTGSAGQNPWIVVQLGKFN